MNHEYTIAQAAALAGLHPQMLRAYERKGLLTPRRTFGDHRRYTDQDLFQIRRIRTLTGMGMNLRAVKQVQEMEKSARKA